MKKQISALCLVLALLSGCAPAEQAVPTPSPVSTATEPTVRNHTVTPRAAQFEKADRAISSLGLDLLRASRENGENTMVSPLSAALCLSMVANGAAGETLEQFLALLGEGCTLEELNANAVSLMADYSALGGGTVLEIADSLWLENGFQTEQDFLLACQAFYQAQTYTADFTSPETLDEINGWVSAYTHGKIEKLLDKLSPETAAILINAIYLDAKWEKPFDGDDTRPWTFRPAQGAAVETDFMGHKEEWLYFATKAEAGVVLPYTDGRLGFVAVLPAEGVSLSDYLALWDENTITRFLSSATQREVVLRMPKFKAEWGGELTDTLKALGLNDAFDSSKADFSAMGKTVQNDPVYLSKVVQKTFINVYEEGTEAAAVTGAIMYAGGAPAPVDYVSLVLERPFVYAIVDLERGVPLFLGTFETP